MPSAREAQRSKQIYCTVCQWQGVRRISPLKKPCPKCGAVVKVGHRPFEMPDRAFACGHVCRWPDPAYQDCDLRSCDECEDGPVKAPEGDFIMHEASTGREIRFSIPKQRRRRR